MRKKRKDYKRYKNFKKNMSSLQIYQLLISSVFIYTFLKKVIISRVFQLFGWLLFYRFIYEKSRQRSYQSNSTVQARYVKFIPLKMCGLFHAAHTSFYGLCYIAGIVSEYSIYDARIGSIAFLIVDAIEHWRVYYAKSEYDQHVQLKGLQSLTSKKAASLIAHHPFIVTFHHVCTALVMFGIGFYEDIAGCILFFQSELPVILISIAQLLTYLGLEDTLSYMSCNFLSVLTYFVCRVVFFPLVFTFVILPNMSVSLFSLILTLCLLVIYFLNLLTFNHLLNETNQQFPIRGDHVLQCTQWLFTQLYGNGQKKSASSMDDDEQQQHEV